MALTRSRAQLAVGVRVVTGTKRGTIRFMGPTEFATGDWIGIELDQADGKNDGSVNGVRYFECPENHGLFVKKAQVRIERDEGATSTRLEEIRAKRAAASAQESGSADQPKSPVEDTRVPASPKSPGADNPFPFLDAGEKAQAAPASAKAQATPTPAPAEEAPAETQAERDASLKRSTVPAEPVAAQAARTKAATRSTRAEPVATGAPTDQARPGALSPPRTKTTGLAGVRSAAERKSLATSAREQSGLSPKRAGPSATVVSKSAATPASTGGSSVGSTSAAKPAGSGPPGHVSHISEDESTLKLKYMLSEKDAQLAVATREIARLEDEVESLRMEVVTAKSQADNVANRGDVAAKDAQSKVQALEQLSTAHDAAQQQIRQLNDQLSKLNELQEENADLRTRLLESDTSLRVLQEKQRQTEGDEHTRNAQLAKDKAATASDKRKIQELEQQVTTLSDSLEMLTLDKEQLAVDKEILEDNLAEVEAELATVKLQLEVGVESAGTSTDEELSEQNERLKEALRRLRDSTSQEAEEMRKKVRGAEKDMHELANLRTEVVALRDWKQSSTKRIHDLQEQVDEAGAYQDLLEKLTDRNMSLSDRISQQNIIVADLESAQEIYEELDATQKQEIQGLRKELEQFEHSLKKRGDALLAQEKQINDLKQDLLRYKTIAGKLKKEVESLNSQAAEESEKLEAVRGHAKSALSIRQQLAESRRQASNFEVNAKLQAVKAAAAIARIDRVEVMMSLENVSAELHLCNAEVSMAKCIATCIAARDLLSRGEENDTLYLVAEGNIQRLLLDVLSKARTAVSFVQDPDHEPLAVAALLGLGSKFQRVERAISDILKNEADLASQQGKTCIQALADAAQECTLEEIAVVPDAGHANVAYRTALHLCQLGFAAQYIGHLLGLFLRSEDLSEDSFQSISLAHQECVALATEVQRACSRCAGEPSSALTPGASDFAEISQELSDSRADIVDLHSKLGDVFSEYSSDSELLLSQVMDLMPSITNCIAEAKDRFQSLGQRLESKLPSIPNLFCESAAWAWLKPSTQQVAWRVRVAKVRQELEHKFAFEEIANTAKAQLASTASELDLKVREVSALQTRLAEMQDVLESHKAKQPEIDAMKQESDRRYVENVELAQENKALQEAIEIFEKKIESMEAEHRRQSASSKTQSRTGDFLSSDTVQSMRDTFRMLRDDAYAWRLAATKSLMNELVDLPSIGPRLEAVTIGDEQHDEGDGVEEEKAADLRESTMTLPIHQASADVRRVYRDARLQRAGMRLVDLAQHKHNARSVVVSQEVVTRREIQAHVAVVEKAHRSVTQDQTTKFRESYFNPDITIQLPSAKQMDLDRSKLVGRVKMGVRQRDGKPSEQAAVRCVVDQVALSKLLRIVA